MHIKARLFGYADRLPIAILNRKNNDIRDALTLDTPIVNYVSEKNKTFLQATLLSNSLAHSPTNLINGTVQLLA
ncbi:hypothetical protein [Advenella sp. S44]|uniref:hypothetical protein n=1 Tax=Advenella sp. S44 TaxID=1982755 RepID=UPI0018D570CA|nr:hypothetical protein [Advenella sp. S44]